jgi:glycosyltransferase involved in cell wall biosynthesis
VWSEARRLSEPARSRVIMTGYVSDEDKHVLVAGARALAYPSLYEGFGFPVIEAMAAGTPVLTSNVSSLPEVAGEDAVLVDPKDVPAIADGLRRVLEDDELRSRLIGPGRARAAGFTWEATARRTAEVLRSVAAAAGRGLSPPGRG